MGLIAGVREIFARVRSFMRLIWEASGFEAAEVEGIESYHREVILFDTYQSKLAGGGRHVQRYVDQH